MASKVPVPPPSEEELRENYIDLEMSMADLAKLYDRSVSTVHKWIHGYGITVDSRSNGSFRVTYKEINGLRMKRCPSVKHKGPEYLPLDYFYIRANGNPRSSCIRCEGCDGPMVLFSTYYKSWIKSIINRLGMMETCRRLEISEKTYYKWTGLKPPRRIRRKHARAIVHLMRELRHTGEVRHKRSIHRGASQRGETERPVRAATDFYKKSGGDAEAEYRRSRRRDPEIARREADAQRARRRKKREQLTQVK